VTPPIAAPAMATSGRDFDPTSSSCRISSRHSYGGVTAARKNCQEKNPSPPHTWPPSHGDQRQRLRSNFVELPNQLAPFIRRRNCSSQNLPGKDPQLPEPLEKPVEQARSRVCNGGHEVGPPRRKWW